MSVVLDLETIRQTPKLPPLPSDVVEFRKTVEGRGGKVHSIRRAAARIQVSWSRSLTGAKMTTEFVPDAEYARLYLVEDDLGQEAEIAILLDIGLVTQGGRVEDYLEAAIQRTPDSTTPPGFLIGEPMTAILSLSTCAA